jgi:amino acid transporter
MARCAARPSSQRRRVRSARLAVAGLRSHGPATPFDWAAFVPRGGLRDLVFWGSIVFALGGAEAAGFMRREIKDPRRMMPRALLMRGAICTTGYILGTLAILIILPSRQVSGFSGIMDAVVAGAGGIGWGWLAPVVAMLLVWANVGAVGAWITATARLPYVAGIDRYLPASFARMHPRWGTPHVSFLWGASLSTVFIVLGELGTTVAGGYQILVSMSIIGYFLPYLFTFAACIRVQSRPAGREVIRAPGGRVTATVLAIIGFSTTLFAIVLACVPDAAETNKPFAVVKVVGSMFVLVAVGQALYARRTRARRAQGTLAR